MTNMTKLLPSLLAQKQNWYRIAGGKVSIMIYRLIFFKQHNLIVIDLFSPSIKFRACYAIEMVCWKYIEVV